MSVHPILFLGGSGAIGHRSAEALRAAYPDVPLLIGGRDLAKAQQAAEEMGGAQGWSLTQLPMTSGWAIARSAPWRFSTWIIPLPGCVSRSSARCRI